MSGAAPYAIPSKAARVLDIERAKKSTPGKTLGKGLGKTWETAKAWMNPALVGGPLHLSSGGALQMFTLGATLALTPSSLKAKPIMWVLLVRYVFMPHISMSSAWSTAVRGWSDSDRLVWCVCVCVCVRLTPFPILVPSFIPFSSPSSSAHPFTLNLLVSISH
ncbi:hypothetical protein FIBSPDRAFT_850137 [Athelia psychrophila]|uniref:Uncharacterized protein n=1 Tax=Athelia psychrophila TaxID=1759441 RepID=A0A166TK26_9AGAM|nr:hypothetical protein FIBSPDRAFT_850137 [Fibularhizoctonia sp. CBS 109695]